MKSLDKWNTTSKAAIIVVYYYKYNIMSIVVLCVQAQNTTSVLVERCVII